MVENAGYIATIADDDELYGVQFRVEGVNHTYELFRDDKSYARLIMGYALPSGSDEKRVCSVANETNRTMKGVKTVIHDGGSFVAFSVEQFFGEFDQVSTQFQRALQALRIAGQHFTGDLFTGPQSPLPEGGSE